MKAPREIRAANWKNLYKILKKLKKKYKIQTVQIDRPDYSHLPDNYQVKELPTLQITFNQRPKKKKTKIVAAELSKMTLEELHEFIND